MKALRELKQELLATFHSRMDRATSVIVSSPATHGEKATRVNAAANAVRLELSQKADDLPKNDRANYSIILQYCFSVISLEYRHKVWTYEYMAFSRRVGELWEAFCSAAWDHPSKLGVTRIKVPDFGDVRQTLLSRLNDNIGRHPKKAEIAQDIATLFEIVGDINMVEDEVFTVDGVPHVIDFKSGFGSNEKGNMLRLMTVGRAYRIWDHRTRLLLLVRQNQNNNYLRVLRRSGLWEVHTGAEAYGQVSAFTGADMKGIRASVIDWKADFSPKFYSFLESQPTNLTAYLVW